MTLFETLDRTLLLMRRDLRPDISDSDLVSALVGTRVVLMADARNLASHSAQSAFVTVATLVARMGMTVILSAPDIELRGLQPPLKPGRLITSLIDLGDDLLPGVSFSTVMPDDGVDIAVLLGSTHWSGAAARRVNLNAGDWTGELSNVPNSPWRAKSWPLGGLAAAALAAGDAFNCTMRKLASHALYRPIFDSLYAPLKDTRFELAPASSPRCDNLGNFDFVSGGAITQSALYALSRIPGVRGVARVIEPEAGDLTNLNRYAMMRRSRSHMPKAEDVASQDLGGLVIEPVVRRYEGPGDPAVDRLGDNVLVGVDHIPSRWQVQREWPNWLGVGATQGYELTVSFHRHEGACAGCVHPVDDPSDGLIPTVSFVSFWSGLLLAALYVRHAAGEDIQPDAQFTSFCALRPDGRVERSAIGVLDSCPVGHRVAVEV